MPRPNKNFVAISASTFAIAAAMGGFAPAAAQEAVAEERATEGSVIIVTAQKRDQNVQEVPVAVNVIGEEDIYNLDVRTFEDVSRVSPSVTIETGDNPNNNVIRMRGIGTAAFSISAESSVAVVVDQVPLILSAQAFGNLEDLQRVEVLRGPQGTLFGKNASAGLINIVTQDPTRDFEVGIGGRVTTDDEIRGSLSLSGPISDTLGFRLNGYVIDREGPYTNLADGKQLGGEESWGVRGKLRFEPTADFDATIIADISERETSSSSPFIALPLNDPGREGIVAGTRNTDVQLDTPNNAVAENSLFALVMNYDFGGVSLSSISSYQRYELNTVIDTDNSTAPVAQNPFLNPTGAPPGTPNVEQLGFQLSEAFSQELRLTSDASGPLEWQAGLWYSKVDHERVLDRGPFRFLLNNWQGLATNESMAMFAQGSWEFTQSTFLDFGFRLNHENISVNYTDFIPNRNNPPSYDGSNPGAPPANYTGSSDDTAATWKLGLRHFLPDDTMIYASVSTGYKGATYDISSGFTQDKADNPIAAENSTNYEIGVKGEFAGGAVRYDLTGFYTDFTDYQAQGAIVLPDGGVEFTLNNVGALRTMGAELNLNWQATDTLNLFFTGAWIDAKIKSFPFADCYFGQTAADGCNVEVAPGVFVQDLGGAELNNSPDFAFNTGAYWEDNVGNLPFNIFLQGNYQWQDDVNYDLFGAPTNFQKAFGIANFSLGIRQPDDRYRVSLFVNNAFNQLYYTRVDDTSDRRTDGMSQITVGRTRESFRYAGIRVDFRF